MRLFTGIDLPDEIKQNLEELIRSLRHTARLRWSRVENLHITTKFIGEWPSERLEELTGALSQLPARDRIAIAIRELGWFPNPRSPRVFWAGIEGGQALADLARETERAMARLGIPEEKRRFSPHLTLARIKAPENLEHLRAVIEGLASREFGSFTADRHCLYLSELTPSGSEYTKLAEFPLGAE